MANDLVRFPEPGDLWEEIDGPGMYTLAVLTRGAEEESSAVGTFVTLTRPAGELLTPLPVDPHSTSLVQATRMGSTERTLRSTKTGEYWTADWTDLTPAGVLLLHQIHTCFMRPPALITFLGNGEQER